MKWPDFSHRELIKVHTWSTESFWPSGFTSVIWIRASTCIHVTLAMSYLSTGLTWYSVGLEISCGARKLARTSRITKKKEFTREDPRAIFNSWTLIILKKNIISPIRFLEKKERKKKTLISRLDDMFFFIINVGVRTSLRVPQLIIRTLKLTTI